MAAPRSLVVHIEPARAEQVLRVGHGLVYVHRDGQGHTILDRGAYQPGRMPIMPHPERDVLAALLRFALSQLELMADHEREKADNG